MEILGRYREDGYAHIRGLLPEEVARSFMAALKQDVGDEPIALSSVDNYPNLLQRPAFELYGHHYKPMLFFLYGLTPIVSQIAGCALLPSYDYFRIYREGDICRVHGDRYACEHSLSLTLDYSDGAVWPLEVARIATPPSARVEEDFAGQSFASIDMSVGDAVLYRGVDHRHGRTLPNPNGWSAHLFLHWVERDGRHASHAFDGAPPPMPVDFNFT